MNENAMSESVMSESVMSESAMSESVMNESTVSKSIKNGEAHRLCIFTKEEPKTQAVSFIDCVLGKGVQGDRFALGGERQVSLLDGSSKFLRAQSLLPAGQQGLCVKRFKGNIEIINMDFAMLKTGDVLSIGGTMLQISEGGKRCYGSQCVLYRQSERCPALVGQRFATVQQSGTIFLQNKVEKITENERLL